jgi:protocatechuate 3,4-dioxygenase beta subunit
VWFFRGAPQSGNGLDKRLSEVASNTSRATGVGNIGNSAPVVVPFNAPSAPDYTFPAHLEDRASTRVVAALPETESISAEPDRAPKKITTRDELATEVPPAPMQTAAKTSGRDRSPHLAVATKKIVADVTAAPAEERPNSNARDRSSVVAMRAKKIPPQVSTGSPEPRLNIGARDRSSEEATPKTKIGSTGPASIQGFVKDSKGEPIKGADLRIESRDGKQVFRTVRTDPTGRYSSPGLQPGVYRVTLVVNGAVKASITNTQAKENQPTQLNFDFKGTTQTSTAATTGRKHMVWVPNRTGSHIGGTWVEVDDKGTGHAESNMQTYTTRQ